MKLSMSNIAWAPEERLAAYAALAEAGVTGLEIAPGLFFHTASDPFQPDERVARAALDEIAADGLTLKSMQSLLFGVEGAALFEGADACTRLELGMARAIALAGRFGIPNLVFGSPGQRRVPAGMMMDAALEQGADVFRRLGDLAQAAGTKIAVESNPEAYGTNFLNTLDQVVEFVERVDHPAVVLILDLGAMHMNGVYDQTPTRIPEIASRLNHVHVSEPNLAPAPAEAATLAPILGALRDASYQGAVSIEMKRPADGLAGVHAALHRLRAAERFDD